MRNRQTQRNPSANENRKIEQPQKLEKYHSWAVVRSLWTCRNQQQQLQVQQMSAPGQTKQQLAQRKLPQEQVVEESRKECKKMRCSGSLCNNTKVMHRSELPSPGIHRKRNSFGTDNSRNASSRSMKGPLHELNRDVSASTSSISASSHSSSAGSFRSMPFSRFSGCYECRMVVDPVLGFTRDPSLRTSICSCPECGEIFMKAENLELHQAVRHAVSELGPEDTSKNIVEIIFHSSWLKKETPVCKIERILKVQNTQKTIGKFEEYRDSIKAKATKLPKKHPRCIADGNELLRFHCTTLICSLGLNGSSNICNSIPQCNVCSIVKSGFRVVGEQHEGTIGKGILTTATSGRAHDNAEVAPEEKSNNKRAMLVCRVIAGRVKKNSEGSMEEYDSIAGAAGAYSNLDELYVFNPRAILPCFVVIYTGF